MIDTKEHIAHSILVLIVRKRKEMLTLIQKEHSLDVYFAAQNAIMNSLDDAYYSRLMTLLNDTVDFYVKYGMDEESLLRYLHTLTVNPFQIRREDTPGNVPWNYFNTYCNLEKLGLLITDIKES